MGASRSGIYSHVEVYAKSESEPRIEHAGENRHTRSGQFLVSLLRVSIDFP
jgi:hypothetical protein